MLNPAATAPDYLTALGPAVRQDEIRALRRERIARLAAPRFDALHAALAALPERRTEILELAHSAVTIGSPSELTASERRTLEAAACAFVPWKKGPFSLFGIEIDAEWRSDLKWARVEPVLAPLAGRVVADIGCNNGYFMYRLAAHAPALVVGFEPDLRHALAFDLLQRYARTPGLVFEPLGVEHMDLYAGVFDTVLCMGILYHHTDPVGLLRRIHRGMAAKGQLIVECQGIAGEDSVALVPEGRYGRARGIWFLPTRSCLANWLRRAGFIEIHCFYDAPLSSAEQRRTSWAPGDSLEEFLWPGDPTRTVEGYPAPRRIYFSAHKP